jgi:molybdopterin molybdotransferase
MMKSLYEVYTPQEARDILMQSWTPKNTPVEKVGLTEALGRTLAADIIAPENLPGFTRSVVDGFAVRAKDTFGASEGMPIYLKLVGEILMGQEVKKQLNAGECMKISTGGMLPPGADSVVMLEYTEEIDTLIGVARGVAPYENIVREDEDIQAGEILLQKGRVLRPQDLGGLSGLGLLEVPVRKRPRVAIISTGDEVVEPHLKPGMGQVRDINSYALAGIVIQEGGTPWIAGLVKDNRDNLARRIKEGLEGADVVVISGGSSVGTRDVTVEAINSLGKPGVLVHGLSIRPGKPTILGVIQDKPILGLPGHPVSAMVIFQLFGIHILHQLLGRKNEEYTASLEAVMGVNVPSLPGREDYLRVILQKDGETWVAMPIYGKSGLITTMVKADGQVKIPRDSEGVREGQKVKVEIF